MFYEENNKAIPNKEAFQKIDKAKKIIYETEQGNNKKEDVYCPYCGAYQKIPHILKITNLCIYLNDEDE